VRKLIEEADPEGEPFETEMVGGSGDELQIKATHRRSGLARFLTLSAELFNAPEYRRLVDVHAELLKQVGQPPFTVTLKNKTRVAESFSALHQGIVDISKEGVNLSRYKGLGEMNADQLRETTMDPATRTLQQVTIDDAALAERIFTELMGDKVEPRKRFIEKHAQEVRFLDV
jgi:DNA gyrase subunit B